MSFFVVLPLQQLPGTEKDPRRLRPPMPLLVLGFMISVSFYRGPFFGFSACAVWVLTLQRSELKAVSLFEQASETLAANASPISRLQNLGLRRVAHICPDIVGCTCLVEVVGIRVIRVAMLVASECLRMGVR